MLGNFSYYNPTNEMIAGITETTVVYPAGYLNLTKKDLEDWIKKQ